jgi:hypothetical protein
MEKIAEIIDKKNDEILNLYVQLGKLKMFEKGYNDLYKDSLELIKIAKEKDDEIKDLREKLMEVFYIAKFKDSKIQDVIDTITPENKDTTHLIIKDINKFINKLKHIIEPPQDLD